MEHGAARSALRLSRWGHSPAHPRLDPVRSFSEKMLAFVGEAMKQTGAVFVDPKRFPELAFVWRGGRMSPAERRRRSERREALVLVARLLVYRWDARTMRVGAQTEDDRCIGITVEVLGAWSGLTRSRVERALADLHRAGYLESVQPRSLAPARPGETGRRYVGLPAVRRLTRLWFHRLGLSRALGLARKRAFRVWKHAERQRQREREPLPAALEAARALDRRPPGRRAERRYDEATARRYVQVQAELVAENRTRESPRTSEELRAEARRRCGIPPGS